MNQFNDVNEDKEKEKAEDEATNNASLGQKTHSEVIMWYAKAKREQ